MTMTPQLRKLIESLETRRLLTGYIVEPDSFDGIDLVPGVDTELLNHTDDGWASLSLDFNGEPTGDEWVFRFYGELYTELFVSANGLITFGTGSTSSSNTDLTNSPALPTIAVLWDDWDTSIGTGSSVLYKIDRDRRELIIEWNNVTHVDIGGNNGVTFHATLDIERANDPSSDNDKIEIHYKDLLVGNPAYDNGASATVGVKAAGTQGDDRLLLGFNGVGPHVNLITSNQGLEIEDKSSLPPLQYLTSSFGYQTLPHSLTMQFSRPVTNVEITDLTVQPQGGTSFHPEDVLGIGTSTLTFTFAGVLPEGQYTATILAGAITDTSGTPLGSDAVAQFLFMIGDANNNGTVNLQDFNILAANFGQSPRDFSQGDFNYDTVVNLADFNLLAARFGQSVGPATTASPFGDSRIGAADEDDSGSSHRSTLA